jgi:sugar phosphate isomerase/epimerase
LKISLATGTLYIYPLRTVFRWARAAGFDGVELSVTPEAIARGGWAVQELAAQEGIEILTVHPTVVPLPGWWERRTGISPTVRLALETGACVVVMHTPKSESLEEGPGLAFRRQVEAWQPRLSGSGLRLAVENKAIHAEAARHYALTPLHHLRAFADRYDLGLVLDTTHAGTAGEDLMEARQIYDGRLVNVHLSDVGGRVPLQRLPGARRQLGEHRLPGTGDLPLRELLGHLGSDGYGGPITLEVNPFEMRVWWPPALRRRLSRTAGWIRQAVAPQGEPVA